MNKETVLYLSYTGLLEPLGKSQILAYLSRLSKNYQFILVTYEKKDDFDEKDKVKELNEICERYNIIWKPKIYHKNPRLLATAWDLASLLFYTFKYTEKYKISLIHCRSYIPSISAYIVGKVTKIPFVFDMRALWPEEMVDAKRLQRSSIVYKALKFFEKKLLQNAGSVVSLTHAAVPFLISEHPTLSEQKFAVIPTCVDLDRFDKTSTNSSQDVVIGTMGTVISGWYHLDWLFETLKLSETLFEKPDFKIITKDDNCKLNEFAHRYSLDNLTVKASTPESIQQNIQDISFAILYFTAGVSKIGSAPTRMAEFLACGIPILGNRGVGDMADLIEKYNIGIVVEDGSTASLITGLNKMKIFLTDLSYPERCKQAAVELFSADVGAEKYKNIYESIINE